MIHIDSYLQQLLSLMKSQFGSRLLYIGLQGSYLRGEATENSDIDVMVILDTLSVNDLELYRSLIRSLPAADKSCGFICGRQELANWNPMEINNLLNSTKDYYGSLNTFVPEYSRRDTVNFVKLSLNDLYHGLCHSYIHGKGKGNTENLLPKYKGVFFILQNMHFLSYDAFLSTKDSLLCVLDGKDREVLQRSIDLSHGKSFPFEDSFTLLFEWCRDSIQKVV